ncbi:MAG: TonB-dependent receptor [Acidobacteria bacterium]|nr:TonB-dependent receptor [Acidobacteriota bacterium]
MYQERLLHPMRVGFVAGPEPRHHATRHFCLAVCLPLLAFFLLGVTTVSWSQGTTAAITGTVKDSTGAVMPGVSVTVRNVETGVARTVQSGAAGRYSVSNIAPGQYEVQVEISGFQSEVRRGIEMTMGREAIVDFTLQVGQVAEQVVVTGEAPLVDTSSAAMAGLVDQQQVEDLPLNGRSLTQLASLQPGVMYYRSASACTGMGENISIGGARTRQVNFLLNGTSILNYFGKSPGGVSGHQMGAEAVREFTVLTSSYSAEFGKSAGGVVNAVTKSGTNTFHGSLYEYLRNDNLEATRWEDNAFAGGIKPQFTRNQFGGSLGGPIRRDQTFFFLSTEYLRDRFGNSTVSSYPTAAARQGQVPRVPPFIVNPAIKPWLDLLPIPTGQDLGDGTARHPGYTMQPTNQNYGNVRIDHRYSDSDSLYGSYVIDDSERINPTPLGIYWEALPYRGQYITLEETRIASPTLLNTAHFGYNRSKTFQDPECTDLMKTKLAFAPGGYCGRGGLSGLGAGFGPRRYIMNSFQYWDTLAWTRGIHSFTFGGYFERQRLNGRASTSPGGQYGFFGGIENQLQAIVQFYEAPLPGTIHWRGMRQNLGAVFANDSMRLRSNLTVNLGLRYEPYNSPTEVNGLLADIPCLACNVKLGEPFFENPSLKNFSPRVGIAWAPGGRQTTSVRAGFGIFYDPILHHQWLDAPFQAPPYRKESRITFTRANPGPFPNGYDLFLANDPRIVQTLVNSIQAKPSQPYSMQYNFSVQQQLPGQVVVQLAYVGTGSRHIPRTQDNQAFPTILPDGRIFFPVGSVRRNPNVAELRFRSFDSNSSYNSLQLVVRRRFSQWFGFQLSYTYSKTIDIKSDIQGSGDMPNDEFEAALPEFQQIDRGRSALDARQNFSTNFTVDLPFARDQQGVAGKVLGGWKALGIVSLQTGLSFSPTIAGSVDASIMRTQTTRNQMRPSWAPGCDSKNAVLGTPSSSDYQGTNPRRPYLDPACFVLPEPGFLGNVGRNVFTGPGVATLDFSLVKNTAIRENINLEFRAEMFNVLNRVNFSSPSRQVFNRPVNVPVGGFATITSTVTSPRQIQLALRLTF